MTGSGCQLHDEQDSETNCGGCDWTGDGLLTFRIGKFQKLKIYLTVLCYPFLCASVLSTLNQQENRAITGHSPIIFIYVPHFQLSAFQHCESTDPCELSGLALEVGLVSVGSTSWPGSLLFNLTYNIPV